MQSCESLRELFEVGDRDFAVVVVNEHDGLVDDGVLILKHLRGELGIFAAAFKTFIKTANVVYVLVARLLRVSCYFLVV